METYRQVIGPANANIPDSHDQSRYQIHELAVASLWLVWNEHLASAQADRLKSYEQDRAN
jgi:hypothetical protein